jgi:hypothetical protein
VQPSSDSTHPTDATRPEPPRSWLAVAALLEQHGFGELACSPDDAVAASDGAEDDS